MIERLIALISIVVLLSFSAQALDIHGKLGGFNWDFKYEKGECKIVDGQKICIWNGKIVPVKRKYEPYMIWGQRRIIEREEPEPATGEPLMKGNFSGWRTKVG